MIHIFHILLLFYMMTEILTDFKLAILFSSLEDQFHNTSLVEPPQHNK